MRTLHHYSMKGEILYSSIQYPDAEGNYPEIADPNPYVVGGSINSQHYYVDNGELVQKPDCPSPHHDWNWDTWAWDINIEKCRADAVVRIDKKREASINSAIEYQGSLVDADSRAQRNITAKINELNQRASLGQPCPPELRLWRDATNTMHAFESDEEYLEWLSGLSVAITTRGTQAYADSWTAKELVLTSNDPAVINAVVGEYMTPFIQLVPFRAE